MTIINPSYIYTDHKFHDDLAVAFDTTIQAIDSYENLTAQYPDAKVIEGGKNSVLYPGFINSHVHLEFSANKTTLQYGDFMTWLESVIVNRDSLINTCDNAMIEQKTQEMLRSGVTSFGAISSFGAELEVCANTPQKVVFFNELIGSNAAYADVLYGDFLDRLDASKSIGDGVIAGIAIHSPYSVHPILLKRAIEIAQNENLPLSAHFMESPAEREWLKNKSGEFLNFFRKYFNSSSPVTTIEEFIESFDNIATHFTHAVQANDQELDYLASKNHSIAHCPRSNRLLGCGRLEIKKLIKRDIPFSIATDGLSSNSSLNIFDELRAALMLHHLEPLETLAKLLIKGVSSIPAKALGINSGEIAIGKEADFAMITLPDKPNSLDDIALQTILHTHNVDSVLINGETISL